MRIGYIIRNCIGVVLVRVGTTIRTFEGKECGTINQAEYLALIEALRHAIRLGFTEAECRVDSQLLARQLSGQYRVKDRRIARLFREIRDIRRCFSSVVVSWTSRGDNTGADELTHQTVFEQPSVTVASSEGRYPRKLANWQACRIRRWFDSQPDMNEQAVRRIFGVDATGIRQILRGSTYRGANEDEAPNWDEFRHTLLIDGAPDSALDDGTGWPDKDDLEEILGDPQEEDEGEAAYKDHTSPY